VEGFATRLLQEAGVDTWVDLLEMLPGDNLVEKIFEEGLGGADTVIAVVSRHSLKSCWVKEELSTAKVLQVEGRCRLIPVIIDDVEDRLPVMLKSALWQRIGNLDDYDEEFRRIRDSIYNRHERPALGAPPSASSDEMVVKVYPLAHETTYLCASRQRRRARNPGEAGLRSPDAFTLRRCQILLASDRGENAYQIARSLGCNPQTVRNATSTPSTRRGSRRRFGKAPNVRTPFTGPSRVPNGPRPWASFCTTNPGSTEKTRVCGRWISLLR
jgi:hypothetical protein